MIEAKSLEADLTAAMIAVKSDDGELSAATIAVKSGENDSFASRKIRRTQSTNTLVHILFLHFMMVNFIEGWLLSNFIGSSISEKSVKPYFLNSFFIESE